MSRVSVPLVAKKFCVVWNGAPRVPGAFSSKRLLKSARATDAPAMTTTAAPTTQPTLLELVMPVSLSEFLSRARPSPSQERRAPKHTQRNRGRRRDRARQLVLNLLTLVDDRRAV